MRSASNGAMLGVTRSMRNGGLRTMMLGREPNPCVLPGEACREIKVGGRAADRAGIGTQVRSVLSKGVGTRTLGGVAAANMAAT